MPNPIPAITNINFMRFNRVAIVLSGLFFLVTLALLATRGMNYGIDFTGGALVQIQTPEAQNATDIRTKLAEGNIAGATLQQFGADNEFLIRLPAQQQGNTVQADIQTALPKAEIRRVEFVGPQIGQELRTKGLLAILASMLAILAYVGVRFQLRYGVGAIVALVHDVLLTVGVFALLQKEVTLPVLAALLTIIGYSLNDTIVVYDRVRENHAKEAKAPMNSVINLALNQTLSRTVMTSVSTLLVLIALLVWGGAVIHDFAFTLCFGVLVGTYSSVFVAAPTLLSMEGLTQRLEAKRAAYEKEKPSAFSRADDGSVI